MIRETQRRAVSGWPVLWILLAVCGFAIYAAIRSFTQDNLWWGLG